MDTFAHKLREIWKRWIDPIPSVAASLENKGIKIIEADLPERFDGLSCNVSRSSGKPNAEVVAVSSRTKFERTRFIFAHELAYLVIRETGYPEIRPERA